MLPNQKSFTFPFKKVSADELQGAFLLDGKFQGIVTGNTDVNFLNAAMAKVAEELGGTLPPGTSAVIIVNVEVPQ